MNTTQRFEHTSVVLHVEEKNLTLSYKDVLQGLAKESVQSVGTLGDEGWELVSVVRYGGLGETHALLAFFKRPKV